MENDDAPTQEEVTELAKLAQRFNNAFLMLILLQL